RAALLRAVGDGAPQVDHAVLDHHVDRARVDVVVFGQSLADLFGDARIGAAVALGPSAAMLARGLEAEPLPVEPARSFRPDAAGGIGQVGEAAPIATARLAAPIRPVAGLRGRSHVARLTRRAALEPGLLLPLLRLVVMRLLALRTPSPAHVRMTSPRPRR